MTVPKTQGSQRLLCAVVALVFMLTSVPLPQVWAATTSTQPPQLDLHQLDLKAFSVPAEWGYVTQVWQPQDHPPRGLIVHLQDLHTHAQAQQHVSELIGFVHEHYGLDLVALEGAGGLCDTSLYSDFPNPASTEKIAKLFLREGLFTGAEYYSVTHPKTVMLWGVEDESLYLKHLNVHQRNIARAHSVRSALAQVATAYPTQYPLWLQPLQAPLAEGIDPAQLPTLVEGLPDTPLKVALQVLLNQSGDVRRGESPHWRNAAAGLALVATAASPADAQLPTAPPTPTVVERPDVSDQRQPIVRSDQSVVTIAEGYDTAEEDSRGTGGFRVVKKGPFDLRDVEAIQLVFPISQTGTKFQVGLSVGWGARGVIPGRNLNIYTIPADGIVIIPMYEFRDIGENKYYATIQGITVLSGARFPGTMLIDPIDFGQSPQHRAIFERIRIIRRTPRKPSSQAEERLKAIMEADELVDQAL